MHTYNSGDLGGFASLILADTALADRLSRIGDAGDFVRDLERVAQTYGIALNGEMPEVRPDPLGLARWTPAQTQGAAWPPPPWLPMQVSRAGERLVVDWAYFGTAPLTEPFFEGQIRLALRSPFARLFRYRTTVDDFLAHAETESLEPSGLIFHMSRCGSTLAAQMLAAVADNIVISEAAPLDAALQLCHTGLAADKQTALLRAMAAAFGRKRTGRERRFFIKLDSWHALALPLLRRAFPETPWVFLFRDPVEVMVSQMRQPGMQLAPEFVPPGLYGLEYSDIVNRPEYCARVLARTCRAAVDHFGEGRGLAIDYRELPDAVFTKMLPHFGFAPDTEERAAMQAAAQRDAKAPRMEFTGDSADKQREASEEIRLLAERHLGAVYRELQRLSG